MYLINNSYSIQRNWTL